MDEMRQKLIFSEGIIALWGIFMFLLIYFGNKEQCFPFRAGRVGYTRHKFDRLHTQTGWQELDRVNDRILWLDISLYFLGSRFKLKAMLKGMAVEDEINELRALRLRMLLERHSDRSNPKAHEGAPNQHAREIPA